MADVSSEVNLLATIDTLNKAADRYEAGDVPISTFGRSLAEHWESEAMAMEIVARYLENGGSELAGDFRVLAERFRRLPA